MSEPPDLSGIADWPVIDATGDDPVEIVTVPVLATWPAVELAAVGEWPLSTGVANFTSADFAQACAAVQCPSVGAPVIKLGHRDPRFDGEPAIGWVASMRLNETQTKLLGDFTGMPGWLAGILPSAYPNRSIEGCWNFICQTGHRHPFVITAVALLGVTPPGIGTIGSLNDVAGLYGVDMPAEPVPADAAAARTFRILASPGETTMPPQTQTQPAAAGVVKTVDDIRHEFYEMADWSQWIVEVQLTGDGPVLIVIDDDDEHLYRVPVVMPPDGDLSAHITFGDYAEVLVSYIDAPPGTDDDAGNGGRGAMAAVAAFPPGRKVAASWGSRRASRAGVVTAAAIASHTTPTDTGTWDGNANQTNLPTEEGTADDYRQAYAWADPDGDPDTKAAYRFIHHMVSSDGTVGAASTVGCSAGIGVLNGGRGGTTIPDDDVQGVYNHLARHLTDADLTPPELASGGAPQILPAGGTTDDSALEDDPDVAGALRHGSFDGEHEHPHADGSGGVHHHMHSHAGTGLHDHAHDDDAQAGAPAPPTTGRAEMEFSDEQMAGIRKALGKKDDEEITAAELAEAMTGVSAAAPAGVIRAGAVETPDISDGTYLVDGLIIKDWQERAKAGDFAVRELHIAERNTILAAAVAAGKFPQSRLPHYEQMWDKDPDGTRKHVDTLAAGLVPMVGPVGSNPNYDPDLPGDFEGQSAYRQLYPEDAGTPGVGNRR